MEIQICMYLIMWYFACRYCQVGLTFPERYINVRDIGKEIGSVMPEVCVNIKVKESKREQILKLLFGDDNIDILN